MRTLLTLTFIILTITFGCSKAKPETDPLIKKATDAKIRFQTRMAELLVSEMPQFTEVIETQRDLQIAYAQRRCLRYEYLNNSRPELINREDGYMEWLNFPWTEQDEQTLLTENAQYSELNSRIQSIEDKNKSNPMPQEARLKFAELAKGERMKELRAELDAEFAIIEAQLAAK